MKCFALSKLCLLATLVITSCLSSLAIAESSVWKVTKGNSYLYIGGTVHILPASAFPLPREFEQAYQDSDSIVLETELPDANDMAFQMNMMQTMSYSNGAKITDFITRRTAEKLRQHTAKLGADLIMFEGFKPGFLVSMIALLEAQKAGLSGEGVDIYYSKKAKRDKKPIGYFESPEFQMNMLESLGKGSEDKFISANLASMSDFKQMFTSLLSAWRTGNESQLTNLAINPMKADPKSLKLMLTDRNRNWIKDIDRMFTDNDREFVLVGVAHLVGHDSVLALLKAKGYQVTKL